MERRRRKPHTGVQQAPRRVDGTGHRVPARRSCMKGSINRRDCAPRSYRAARVGGYDGVREEFACVRALRHPPLPPSTTWFRLEILAPVHHDATTRRGCRVSSTSTQHRALRSRIGQVTTGRRMTFDQNLADLEQHRREFVDGEAFAYSVLGSGDVVRPRHGSANAARDSRLAPSIWTCRVSPSASATATCFFVQNKRRFATSATSTTGDGRISLWCPAPTAIAD